MTPSQRYSKVLATLGLVFLFAIPATPWQVPLPSGPGPVVVASATSEGAPAGAPQNVTRPVESYPGGRKATLGGAPSPALAFAGSEPIASVPASTPALTTTSGESRYQSGIGTAVVGGWASWFDVGPGYYAAAGPVLRDALGPNWRGQSLTVQAGDQTVQIRLTDWCACRWRHGQPTILDLSRDAFSVLADPARGIVAVSIELPNRPPPTDTIEGETR